VNEQKNERRISVHYCWWFNHPCCSKGYFSSPKTVQVMVLGINFYHNFILLYRRGCFMNV